MPVKSFITSDPWCWFDLWWSVSDEWVQVLENDKHPSSNWVEATPSAPQHPGERHSAEWHTKEQRASSGTTNKLLKFIPPSVTHLNVAAPIQLRLSIWNEIILVFLWLFWLVSNQWKRHRFISPSPSFKLWASLNNNAGGGAILQNLLFATFWLAYLRMVC
jgi:hypothetical protein